MESRAAHTHPKNTQVPPAPGIWTTKRLESTRVIWKEYTINQFRCMASRLGWENIKQKKCIIKCWASKWFFLFYSPTPYSQVWILIYRNWSIIILRSRTTITVKERGTKTKKSWPTVFITKKWAAPSVSSEPAWHAQEREGGGKKKEIPSLPNPLSLLPPFPLPRLTSATQLKTRRFWATHARQPEVDFFLTLRPWFWTNSWASRLYKSKDTQ